MGWVSGHALSVEVIEPVNFPCTITTYVNQLGQSWGGPGSPFSKVGGGMPPPSPPFLLYCSTFMQPIPAVDFPQVSPLVNQILPQSIIAEDLNHLPGQGPHQNVHLTTLSYMQPHPFLKDIKASGCKITLYIFINFAGESAEVNPCRI